MKRILVANRGEIACRILRTCKRLGLETVAVHSEADAEAMHAKMADRAVPIGASPPAESYLLGERIVAAARATSADGIHPGYGFLSENEDFARAVQAAGIGWIGPDPKSIEDMGDKERARLLAKAAGVPVLPGSARFAPGDVAGIEDAARDVGFPLLVKASAGGGGIGMRRVDKPGDLTQAVESTQTMAARAFGDGTVYLERYIAEARHVEVQVFGFGDGHAVHLNERDCSIQRRFQKIVEETPAPRLSAAAREAMCGAAVALCAQERYRGAGTVEFVLDIETERFYFLEMNTRIQVEHPVTEMVTGLDLVEMQIRLAGGQPLPVRAQTDVTASGHSIECRIYAERPAKGFLPAPGVLSRFDLPPASESVRIDTGVRAGDRVTHFYDPMIAKAIVRGADRGTAIERMLATLAAVSIEGVDTNLAFLQKVIAHAAFRAGDVRTAFVDRFKKDLL
ncbi:MAG TPA: biotin carboxylase N-terminal domain-containing protein [Burkholderiales bacterium]|nr:biotin carboxylase N-terminal domain-containing protein [Burkholderiales bacterium]